MAEKTPIIRYCQVLSVDDPTGGDRIKVALKPEDNDKVDSYGRIDIDKIDYCIPVLPAMLHVKPKVGEGCLVLTAIGEDGNSQRYYIGPVISQPHRMDYDPYFMGGDSQFRGAWKKPDPNPKNGTNKEGVYPDNEDISIEGRQEGEIQIKEHEVRVKAGTKNINEQNHRDITYNSKNPAYVQVKYGQYDENNGQRTNDESNINIVADKVNILGQSSRFVNGFNDANELITNKKLEEIYEKAQRLPYGEELVSFLKLIVDAFVSHTHNYIGLPPNPAYTDALLNESTRLLDNHELLSDNVRIN